MHDPISQKFSGVFYLKNSPSKDVNLQIWLKLFSRLDVGSEFCISHLALESYCGNLIH